jgi:hypothetical protein
MQTGRRSDDLAEQIDAALELAAEAHFEAGRLFGVARVLARRLADPQEEVEETRLGEVDGMEEVKQTQELGTAEAPAEAAGSLVDHQFLPDGIARISAARLRAISGLSPGEFRALASMPDQEFEKAQQVGFTIYLRGPSEVHPLPAAERLEAAE